MLKPHFFIYLIIFVMFTCVRGCPFTGNSARSLSAHQKRCEAHRKDVAHSAEIRKSVAERSKRRRTTVLQRRSHPNEIAEVLFLIYFRLAYAKLLAGQHFVPYIARFIPSCICSQHHHIPGNRRFRSPRRGPNGCRSCSGRFLRFGLWFHRCSNEFSAQWFRAALWRR